VDTFARLYGVMTMTEFEALLSRRDALRESHEAWADEVGGPFGASESGYEATQRDRAWAELEEIEERIAQAIDEEAEEGQ
jgi:hypothetical protein